MIENFPQSGVKAFWGELLFALSVACGDSSPKGRALGISGKFALPA